MNAVAIPADPQVATLAAGGADQNGFHADDSLFEIVNGERVELPPMSVLAGWINNCLNVRLSNFVNAQKLGRVVIETKFILDAVRKFQRKPDVAFVSALTWPLDRPLPRFGDWQVVPDLAVEVVSPHDLFENVLEKIMQYFRFGVKCVWLISPLSAKVFVFGAPHRVAVLGLGDELDGGDIVPGFRLKLSELFRELTEQGP